MTLPKQDPLKVNSFLGLVNTLDPLQAPKGALLVADNINIDNEDSIHRRDGYTSRLSLSDVYGMFSTDDQKHMYAIDDGSLIAIEADFTSTVLATGFPEGVYEWEEVGNKIYILGPKTGVIDSDVFKPWGVATAMQPSITLAAGSIPPGQYQVTCTHRNSFGEEGAAPTPVVVNTSANSGLQIEVPQLADHETVIYISATNGETLYKAVTTTNISFLLDGALENLIVPLAKEQHQRYPVPMSATKLTYQDGRMYVADYSQPQDATYIFHSEPFWLGLFDLFGSYEAVSGQVRMLEAYTGGVLIATDKTILSYSMSNGLVKLADYGVPEGNQASQDPNGVLYFWTNRGVCRVPEFENLTQTRASVAPGGRCVTAFIEQDGYNRFLVSTTDSGTVNNKYIGI